MKTKKLFFVFLLVVLGIYLIACDPPQFYHEDLTDIVTKVELIKYDNSDVENVSNHKNPEKDIIAFDFSKVEIIETLSIENNDNFLQDLSKIFIIANWTFANSPSEQCIRLTYNNGDFEIISYSKNNERLISIYNEYGEVVRYVGGIDGRESYISLVNRYFQTQIE